MEKKDEEFFCIVAKLSGVALVVLGVVLVGTAFRFLSTQDMIARILIGAAIIVLGVLMSKGAKPKNYE